MLEKQKLEDRIEHRGKKYAVIPDGFFGLEDPKGKFYFFLEADRSTMSNRRFLNKMKAYWNWWKQKGHQKKFGIKNFRVLTLTISKERAEELALGLKANYAVLGSITSVGADYSLDISVINLTKDMPGLTRLSEVADEDHLIQKVSDLADGIRAIVKGEDIPTQRMTEPPTARPSDRTPRKPIIRPSEKYFAFF